MVISVQRQELEKEIKQQVNPVVKAKTVFRGTVVTLGQTARPIEKTMTNVVITAEDSLIIIR
jgi:hypothetical protein